MSKFISISINKKGRKTYDFSYYCNIDKNDIDNCSNCITDINNINSSYTSSEYYFLFKKRKKFGILYLLKHRILQYFSFKSFSFIISCINIIIFIIYLIPELIENKPKHLEFLSPSSQTLLKFGALNGRIIRQNFVTEFYRWIANSYLHSDFYHIMGNSFGILTLGSFTEKLVGSLTFSLIYIIGGILGSLFSVLCEPSISSIGASTNIFAILGLNFGYAFINWKELSITFGRKGKFKYVLFLSLFISITTIINLKTHFSGYNKEESLINHSSHIGGLISGYFLSIMLIKPKNEDSCLICEYKYWFYLSSFIVLVYTIFGFLFFYLSNYYSL